MWLVRICYWALALVVYGLFPSLDALTIAVDSRQVSMNCSPFFALASCSFLSVSSFGGCILGSVEHPSRRLANARSTPLSVLRMTHRTEHPFCFPLRRSWRSFHCPPFALTHNLLRCTCYSRTREELIGFANLFLHCVRSSVRQPRPPLSSI